MKPKIKPIRDLYFRFIQNSALDGCLDPQELAVVMASAGYIKLVPHHSQPNIAHYRDADGFDSSTFDTNEMRRLLEQASSSDK